MMVSYWTSLWCLVAVSLFLSVSGDESRDVKMSSTLRRLERVLQRLRSKQLIVTDVSKTPGGSTGVEVVENKPQNELKHNKKIFCSYRVFSDSSVPVTLSGMAEPGLCTHLVVEGVAEVVTPASKQFGVKFFDTVTIGLVDEIERISSKNATKLILSLGEYDQTSNRKFSDLSGSPESRSGFVKSLLTFLNKYRFSGVNFNWRHPTCWMYKCNAGPKTDKKNYVLLAQEVYESFKGTGLLITGVMAVGPQIVLGYDVTAIFKYFDWIFVETNGYRGFWDATVGYAPLIDDITPSLDLFTIYRADMKKLIIMIELQVMASKLADPKKNRVGAKSVGPGKAGKFSKNSGFLFFNELCAQVKDEKWDVFRVVSQSFGYYAFKDDQWTSFEDVRSLKLKAQFVSKLGLSGVYFNSIQSDDHSGLCGCGKFPLITSVVEEFSGVNKNGKSCI